MLKAVKRSDYEKFGCINCGCGYCYNRRGGSTSETVSVKCGECKEEFVVLADGLTRSKIRFGTDKTDENGKTIYEYPILVEHPRNGIEKHKFVRPDVRPEGNIGDFCKPRMIGCDFSCFVKSKQSGQRITDMINKVSKEYEKRTFDCWLDYREHEPLWIQIKIGYPNKLRAKILFLLIEENDCIITEQVVKNAIEMEINFQNHWKYQARKFVDNAITLNFMHDISVDFSKLSKKKKDDIYEKSFQNINYLDQFECYGIVNQIDFEIKKANIKRAIILLKHLIKLDDSRFNKYVRYLINKDDKEYITSLRKDFQDELLKALKVANEELEKEEWKFIKIRDFIPEEERECFKNDWNQIVPLILSVVDVNLINSITKYTDQKSKKDIRYQTRNINSNLYLMFSLFGLYVYVNKQLEDSDYYYTTIFLAIRHISDQLNSDLFKELKNNNDNQKQYMKLYAVYREIEDIASKYNCYED